jgi:tartrate-resistant acid phosphatase type 5
MVSRVTALRSAAAVVAAAAVMASATVPWAGAVDAGPPQGSVAVIGDFGAASDGERAVADLVARARPRAVVTVGDNDYDDRGYPTLVGDYYGRWVSSASLLPAVGNHDHEEGIGAFDSYFSYLDGRHVYAAGRAGMRFFVIDSTTALDSELSMKRQREWLKRSLLASRARWKVVVLHHPPYSSGDVHGSTPEFQWPFAEWGADLVLAGHDHVYERIVADGMTYVVDGSGGKDLYGFDDPVAGSRVRFDSDFGALFLTASDRTLSGEFWSAAGVRVDRFTLHD